MKIAAVCSTCLCLVFSCLQAQTLDYTFDLSGNLQNRGKLVPGSPLILGQPQDRIVEPGEVASFSVVMADAIGLSYQWSFNGAPVPGQTAPSMIVRNATTNSEGIYAVVVANFSGSVTSSPARLYIDSDRDGLPDSWEMKYFGNLTSQRSDGDPDGDRISNLQEFLDGTDPTKADSHLSRLTVLSDGGGIVAPVPLKRAYAATDSVSLAATPFAPNVFYGWGGDLTGTTNPALLTMDKDKSVQAYFRCLTPPADMVAFWKGEQDASDLLGSHPGAFFQTNTSITASVTNGLIGNALFFDGTSHVEVVDSPDLRPAQLTIECWVYPQSLSSTYQTILARGSSFNDDDTYYLGIANGLPYFWTKHSGTSQAINGPTGLPLGKWTHLAATFDGQIKRLYVNGKLASTQTGLGPLSYDPAPIPVSVGADWVNNGPAYLMNGRIDELSLYRRALSGDEVFRIFNAAVAGKCSNTPYLVTPATLPVAVAGAPYSQQITSVLGVAPVVFSVSSGGLPAGLTLSSVGLLSGTPSLSGSNVFGVTVTDALGVSSEQVFGLLVLPSVSASPIPGLVAWWRAENDALDSAGTNHGTLMNGATFAPGRVGAAFSFDGIDDRVAINESASIDISRFGSWTIEAWVRPTSFTAQNYPTIYSEGRWVASLGLNAGTGLPESWVNNGNQMVGTVPLQLNAWNHVAVTCDGRSRSLYVNGQAAGTGSAPYLSPDNNGSAIGDVPFTPNSSRFSGQIDEVSIYNRALDASEIAQVYGLGSLGKPASAPYLETAAVLPDAALGQPYNQAFTSIRGAAPIVYSVSSGPLPPGMSLGPDGVLSGIPGVAGIFAFTVRATDQNSAYTEHRYSLTVISPVNSPAGLIGLWKGENNALDSVGTNHGTLRTGGTYAPGKVGKGFWLDGTNGAVDIPDSPTLRPASLTLEAWVMFNGKAGLQHIFAKALGNQYLDSFGIWWGNGVLTAGVANAPTLTTPLNPVLGRWYHVAFTFDDFAKTEALFLDGNQVGSASAVVSIAYDSHPVLLGRDDEYGAPTYFLSGGLDEAAIYARALSSQDIAAIYAAGAAGRNVGTPVITPVALADAVVGQNYSQQLAASLGNPPFSFSLISGTLPSGMTLSPSGLLAGVPGSAGTFPITIRVTGNNLNFSDSDFSLQVFAPVSPPPGIISWWRAENDGLDSIGTNHGVLTAGGGYGAGKVAQAFVLDGSSGALEIPDAPELHPASLTLEAWVLFYSVGGLQVVFAKQLGTGYLDSFSLWLDGNRLRGVVADPGGLGTLVECPFSPSPQWYHLAYSFDNFTKQQALYINGVQVATNVSNVTPAYDASPVLLGRDNEYNSPAYFLRGRIDEAAIYNRALNPAEIQAIYAASAAGKTVSGPYFSTLADLPPAISSQPYSVTLSAIRGTSPISFSRVSGSLPTGVALAANGTLSGIPVGVGTFNFTARATDQTGLFSDQAFTLTVYGVVSPPGGMVAWYRGENNGLDSAATNHGVLTNGIGFASGEVGQAFTLNGVDGALVIPENPVSDLSRMDEWTIEAWVRPTNFSSRPYPTIYSEGNFAASLGINSVTGKLESRINGGNFLVGTVPLQLGTWSHVALTYDGINRLLYLNGAIAGAGSAPPISPDDLGAAIGSRLPLDGSTAFPGQVDELCIYNRALTPDELGSIYAAGPAGRALVGPYINTPATLADAAVGQAYTNHFSAVRGNPPYSFQLVQGTLPPGLELSAAGVLSGTPTQNGNFAFAVQVTDQQNLPGVQSCSLSVKEPLVSPDGLLGWWRGENNGLDSAGTNHGIVKPGAAYAPGKVGQAFAFDGVSGALEIPDSPSLHPASVTLEAWVNFNQANGLRSIMGKALGNGSLDSFALFWNAGYLQAVISGQSGFGPFLSLPFYPVLGRWYHVAYTFDDATKQQALYLDGVLLTSGTANLSIGYDNHPLLVGRDDEYNSPAYFFSGLIDEASIYNRALGPWEIAALVDAGTLGKVVFNPGLPVQLTASLDNQSISVAFDSIAGNSYTIQYRHALDTGEWFDLVTLQAAGAKTAYSIPITNSTAFYRVYSR